MTLEDAFKVAAAINECWDPPVIEGIFLSLDEAFPEFHFVGDYGTEFGKVRFGFKWGYILVIEKATGSYIDSSQSD